MKIVYCENAKMNHYEIRLVTHPKNIKLAKLLVSQFKETIGEVELYDEYKNKYPVSLLTVYYFEIVDHKIYAYTENDVFRLYGTTMAKLKETVEPMGFYQINVRTIVNVRHVLYYKKQRGYRRRMVLDNKDVLVSSRRYRCGFDKMIEDKHFIGLENHKI